MEYLGSIIGITALAGMGGTGLGGLLSCLFRKDSSKTVSLLLSFAAGIMTSVVCFDLLTEALHPEGADTNVTLVTLGVILGYVVIALLNAIIDRQTDHEVAHIDENHPQTADSLEELTHANHLHEHREGRQPRSGLFLAGLVMAAAIALHNVPEGMAVAVPLISGGMPKWRSVVVTAVTGFPTVLGAILGYTVGSMGPFALTLSLSFASGAMLYVVFGELLPEAILMWRSKLPAAAAVIGILTGIFIIYV